MSRATLLVVLIAVAGALRPVCAWAARTPPVSAALRCEGASTMQDLVAAWMRVAHARFPSSSYRLVRGSRFSATGVRAALHGRVACVTFAREPFPAENRAYRNRYGSAPILIPVAQGSYRTPHGTFAIAVYVNRDNPLRRLSMRQLHRVLAMDRTAGGSVHTWGELGADGAMRNRPVHVYGMQPLRATGNPPGIVNFLEFKVLGGTHWRRDLRARTDTRGTSALTAIVRAVAQDPDGIGYSGVGYADRSVAALALSRKPDGPYYLPTRGNVATARYPLSRRIYLGFNPGLDGRTRHAACRLLAVALGERGYALDVADHMHFLPLTEAQTRKSMRLAHRELGCPSAAFGETGAANSSSRVPGRARGRPKSLTIIGYNDMAAIFRNWDGEFARLHPGVRFRVQLHGTRTAPMALARGRSQLAPMGAPFSARELRDYRSLRQASPVGFRVAHASNDPRARSSPIGIYVHPSNPIRRITMRQLRQVFGHAPPTIHRTWALLGLKGAWASRRIDVCGLAPSTALGRYMIRRLLAGGRFAAGYLAFSESVAALHQAAMDRAALCFGDLNDAGTRARRVGIVTRSGRRAFTGTRAEIHSGTYPLDRFLYIYVRKNAGRSARGALVCAYLRMALSSRGQALLASAAPGYIPLNVRELHAQRIRLHAVGCGARDSIRRP